jgi:hypothetical protein
LIKRYGVYIVDKKGVIRTYFAGIKTARPRLDVMVKELARIENVKPPKIENKEGKIRIQKSTAAKASTSKAGKQQVLAIRWIWSHDRVRPGDEFKLAFCPVIADGFHVYGAEEKNMTPFKVEFQFPEGIQLISKIAYPDAEVVDDPVLKMKLAVYKKDIPVSTLVFKAVDSLKPGVMTVTASITYQACDDSVCFPPTEIKKTLKLNLVEKEKKRQEVYGWKSW